MKRFILLFFLNICLISYGEVRYSDKLKFQMQEIDANLVLVSVVPEKIIVDELSYPYHTVKKDEYLIKIARIYDKKTKKLIEINELKNPDLIYPRQKIYLERKRPLKMEEVPEYHIVKKGENLVSISFDYDLDWKKVKKLNRLDSVTAVYPGQKIRLK